MYMSQRQFFLLFPPKSHMPCLTSRPRFDACHTNLWTLHCLMNFNHARVLLPLLNLKAEKRKWVSLRTNMHNPWPNTWRITWGERSIARIRNWVKISAYQELSQSYEQLVSFMQHVTSRLAHSELADRMLHKWCCEFLLTPSPHSSTSRTRVRIPTRRWDAPTHTASCTYVCACVVLSGMSADAAEFQLWWDVPRVVHGVKLAYEKKCPVHDVSRNIAVYTSSTCTRCTCRLHSCCHEKWCFREMSGGAEGAGQKSEDVQFMTGVRKWRNQLLRNVSFFGDELLVG